MVLDMRAKPIPFTIDVVNSALQDSVCRWKIDYPEDLEEADILNTLHTSIHSMKTTISTKTKSSEGSDGTTGCICESC